jgi:hypothetical protein
MISLSNRESLDESMIFLARVKATVEQAEEYFWFQLQAVLLLCSLEEVESELRFRSCWLR